MSPHKPFGGADDERLINTAELASWLGVHPKTIHRYRKHAGLPFLWVGAAIRYKKTQVSWWLDLRKEGQS
jgi:hypothetical protein